MYMSLVKFVLKSGNAKTGEIPVSMTDRSTCPDSCSFKGKDGSGHLRGCYAEGWPLSQHWTDVETKGVTWEAFCRQVAALPDGQLWRANQAGDLQGKGNTLDREALASLVEANRGKRGFTYTHKPVTIDDLRRAEYLRLESTGMDPVEASRRAAAMLISPAEMQGLRDNRAAIADANLRGFTVNVSRDSLDAVDDIGIGSIPVVCVLPAPAKGEKQVKVTYTPKGNRVVTCPATYRDEVSCKTCELCQRADRNYAIGFPAHGIAKKVAGQTAANGFVLTSSLNRAKRGKVA